MQLRDLFSLNATCERFLGVPVHGISPEDALRVIGALIAAGKRPASFVVQTNALSLVTGHERKEYREAVEAAALSVPDGMPVVWLLRARGREVRSRVYGPDLMLQCAQEAVGNGWRCFLYGGGPGVADDVAQELRQRFPGLQIVGMYSPPFRDLTAAEEHGVRTMINSVQPDLLWVALGGPRQDLWMFNHRKSLDVSVMHGVGAAFDFISGRVPQAPRWMMNSGLEWLFRLGAEPRRLWKRYTVGNLKLAAYLIADAASSHRRRRTGT